MPATIRMYVSVHCDGFLGSDEDVKRHMVNHLRDLATRLEFNGFEEVGVQDEPALWHYEMEWKES